MGLLVVMGSGETAPPLVPTHRRIFDRVGEGPAVVLDTPFGFQENADELTARARTYFADSVGRDVHPVRWRRADAPSPEREAALSDLREAVWAFAGPGSPTYALRHWRDTPVPRTLADIVRRGGALVLGSAAAVVAGTHAVPVYEIYKAGHPPRWHEGLDLLGDLADVPAAVIPHFDNREGGTHDTRYCYLGERRLQAMEAELPEATGVLGVDEHTALVIDCGAGIAWVEGRGGATIRAAGDTTVLPAGTEVALESLRAWLRGEQAPAGHAPGDRVDARAAAAGADDPGATRAAHDPSRGDASGAGPRRADSGRGDSEEREPGDGQPGDGEPRDGQPGDDEEAPAGSLREEATRQRRRFDTALAAGDVEGCAAAILDLEAAINAWSTDTLQSDDADRAREELRGMVTRLARLARVGARDPRDLVAPLVDGLLAARAAAREAGDFATADRLRDVLLAADVEVRDTPDGVAWLLGHRWYNEGEAAAATGERAATQGHGYPRPAGR